MVPAIHHGLLSIHTAAETAALEGQGRIMWDNTQIDLFFSYNPSKPRPSTLPSQFPLPTTTLSLPICADPYCFRPSLLRRSGGILPVLCYSDGRITCSRRRGDGIESSPLGESRPENV